MTRPEPSIEEMKVLDEKEGNKEQREHFPSPHLGSVMYETWQVIFYSYSTRVESNFPVLELRKVLVNYFTNQICFK